jgi:hypothetical protein
MHRRQAAAFVALAVLCLLGAGLGLLQRHGPPPRSEPEASPAGWRVPPWRSPPASITLFPMGHIDAPGLMASIAAAGFGVEDVCGVGPVPRRWTAASPGDERMSLTLSMADAGQPSTAAIDELVQSLRDASRPRRQGAAWVMQREVPAAEALAQLTLSSHDPVIAHWAVSTCWAADPRGRPPCTALARRWAQLEPDNAAAWLAVLDGDPDAEAEVMQRVALATRFDEHVGEVLREAAQAAPVTWPAAVRLKVLRHAAAGDFRGVASYAPLLQHCAPARLADGDRRQRCEAATELLLAQGRTLVAHAFGLRLAERLAWPEARLAPLRRKQGRMDSAALAQAQRRQGPGAWSCASVESELRHLQALVTVGEWSALAAAAR